ncbi:MAG: hypothetical protein AB1349_10020 [Elusimicrobiota bacterium]
MNKKKWKNKKCKSCQHYWAERDDCFLKETVRLIEGKCDLWTKRKPDWRRVE